MENKRVSLATVKLDILDTNDNSPAFSLEVWAYGMLKLMAIDRWLCNKLCLCSTGVYCQSIRIHPLPRSFGHGFSYRQGFRQVWPDFVLGLGRRSWSFCYWWWAVKKSFDSLLVFDRRISSVFFFIRSHFGSNPGGSKRFSGSRKAAKLHVYRHSSWSTSGKRRTEAFIRTGNLS